MDCFVYVMAVKANDGWSLPVKVGIANNVATRLSTIKTACPYPIGLYEVFRLPSRELAQEVEKSFHRVCKRFRTHGEWFAMKPEAARLSLIVSCTVLYVEVFKEPMESIGEWSEFVGVPFGVETFAGVRHG